MLPRPIPRGGPRSRYFFAVAAARLAIAVAGLVLAVALVAGAVRVLPLVLARGVPPHVAGPLARGVLAVSLETALFVAPPIAWALAAARLVERGEARALHAIGVRPASIVASSWPAVIAMALAATAATAAWGREAAAPGRLVRDLLHDAELACAAAGARAPAAVDVPLVRLSWVCFPGEPPRVIGPAPFGGGRAVLAATRVAPSDDLRAIDLEDLAILVPSSGEAGAGPADRGATAAELRVPGPVGWRARGSAGGGPAVRGAPAAELRVREARVRGLAPLGRASNLTPARRAALMAASAVAMAVAAALLVLGWTIRSRVAALAIGVAGPGAALTVMTQLERAPTPAPLYLGVATAGLLAILASAGLARGWRASTRRARRGVEADAP